MKELRGRVAVVTGGASGIGLAMARRFGEEGMRVVLADVEESALEKAARELVKVSVLYPGPNWMRTGIWSAERNRPAELAQARPASGPRPTFEALKQQMQAAGLPFEETPLEEVADCVVRGIREERFWMLPASERTDASIRARAQSMLERSQPEYMVEKRPPAAGGLARD